AALRERARAMEESGDGDLQRAAAERVVLTGLSFDDAQRIVDGHRRADYLVELQRVSARCGVRARRAGIRRAEPDRGNAVVGELKGAGRERAQPRRVERR